MDLIAFDAAYTWLGEGCSYADKTPSLILGNGFSIAYDASVYSYDALRDRAAADGLLSELAERFFDGMATVDFEVVIKSLLDAARALRIIRTDDHDPEAQLLDTEAAALKEALARSLAGLHPDRPQDVPEEAYERVGNFLGAFKKIYSFNYDLLVYWTFMKSREIGVAFDADDGFREHLPEGPFVVWDNLHSSSTQSVYYVHGALHLFMGEGELRKLTFIRTGEALLDQIRAELDAGRFPLYVAEGTASDKLTRISASHYLAKGLASIAQSGQGLLAYGLSFSVNDEHVSQAIVESKSSRLAVSVYGDPSTAENLRLRSAVDDLVRRREAFRVKHPRTPELEVNFFDAASVRLWH